MGGHVDQGRAVVLEVAELGRVVLLGDVLLLHQARHGESHFLYTKHVDISVNMIRYAIKEYWADRKPG